MKRKEFLKKSSFAIAGGLIIPYVSCDSLKPFTGDPETLKRLNWAGNYAYNAEKLHEPRTVEEVQMLVKELGKQKALGSKHCFNNIADSPENQISLRKFNKLISIDEVNKTVTIEGGARYGDFCEQLHNAGYALHNLASLPHITVAGACTTATHGSGVGNGNLATAVKQIELVKPDGTLVTLDRTNADFYAVVVGLGAFGIITKMTLEIQDTYNIRQDVFLGLPLSSVRENFDEIMSSGYSVSLFTDWDEEKVSEVWIKRRTDNQLLDLGDTFYGATAAEKNVHPIITASAENCTEQMGVPGPWYNRLPHFKLGFTPSSGKELQTEYFIPRKHAVDAIMAVTKLREEIAPYLMISEIRTIAADEFWMSPCYQQDCIAIHTTWEQDTPEVKAILPKIEAALKPFQAKPHWGKLFTMNPSLIHDKYEKYSEFIALAKSYDPTEKYNNSYLSSTIF